MPPLGRCVYSCNPAPLSCSEPCDGCQSSPDRTGSLLLDTRCLQFSTIDLYVLRYAMQLN